MSESCCSPESGCCGQDASDNCICKLSQPAGRFDLVKVIELAKDPRFICKCCGRVAHDEENLCTPVPLE